MTSNCVDAAGKPQIAFVTGAAGMIARRIVSLCDFLIFQSLFLLFFGFWQVNRETPDTVLNQCNRPGYDNY
jgi:hypothetical protein